MVGVVKNTFDELNPTQDEDSVNTVSLCHAAQVGCVDRVRQILTVRPELVFERHPCYDWERQGYREISALLKWEVPILFALHFSPMIL